MSNLYNKNNYNIYIYWENRKNKKTPNIVNKCYNIMKKKHNNIIFLNEKNIKEYIDIIDISHLQHIAHKADYFRAKILHKFGGIWLDIDTILLDNLDKDWEEFYNSDKLVALDVGCIAYMMSKKNNIIFEKWIKQIENIIKLKKHIKWGDIGGTLLKNIIIENNYQKYIYNFPKIVFRIGYLDYLKFYDTNHFTVKNNINKIKNNNIKIIILYGTYMYDKKYHTSSLINQIFNLSHKNT